MIGDKTHVPHCYSCSEDDDELAGLVESDEKKKFVCDNCGAVWVWHPHMLRLGPKLGGWKKED